MCGPEVSGEDRKYQVDSDGRRLRVTIRRGLYHDVFPNTSPDLVVAMNAGLGVTTYAADWRPTLDLLARRPRRALFASTSYTALEIAQEDQLLQRHWAEPLEIEDSEQLVQLQVALGVEGQPPWTAKRCATVPGFGDIQRGDVVLTPPGAATPLEVLPVVLRVGRCADAVYAGPNLTPGRNRNYGKLLRWVGGSNNIGDDLLKMLMQKALSSNFAANEFHETLRLLDDSTRTVSAEEVARVAYTLGEQLTPEELREIVIEAGHGG